MKIQMIEVDGFGSFASWTLFILEKVSLIEGANVADLFRCIRWVFGESPRVLGVAKNEDLIYSGTVGQRAGRSSCESMVTINNQDHTIECGYSTISLRKRTYQTFATECFINYQSCRAPDITEILSGTGSEIGSLALVGPDELESVTRMNAMKLRKVIERMLGLSKVRNRLVEVEKRIHETQQNLVRIGALVEDLTEQQKELDGKNTYPGELDRVKDRLNFLVNLKEESGESLLKLQKEESGYHQTISKTMNSKFTVLQETLPKILESWLNGYSVELVLTDPEHLISTGVKMNILSKCSSKPTGHERKLIGLALLFSLIRINPIPVCVLYNIETILPANELQFLSKEIKELSEKTQFIMIAEGQSMLGHLSTKRYRIEEEEGISKVIEIE